MLACYFVLWKNHAARCFQISNRIMQGHIFIHNQPHGIIMHNIIALLHSVTSIFTEKKPCTPFIIYSQETGRIKKVYLQILFGALTKTVPFVNFKTSPHASVCLFCYFVKYARQRRWLTPVITSGSVAIMLTRYCIYLSIHLDI